MAAISKLIVEDAQSALRELYGLVPTADREKYADANLRTVEIALRTFAGLVDDMRQFESLIERASNSLVAAKQHSDRIQNGEAA